MATVTGGVGYGLYHLAKVTISALNTRILLRLNDILICFI